MTKKEIAAKLKDHAEHLRHTPIDAPLGAINTLNHLLACINSLNKLAADLEAEKEETENEDHNEPE